MKTLIAIVANAPVWLEIIIVSLDKQVGTFYDIIVSNASLTENPKNIKMSY